MSSYYLKRSISYFADGLVKIEHIRFGRQPWARVKVRKKHTCAMCKEDIGEEAYRPITHAGNRYERICLACIEQSQEMSK